MLTNGKITVIRFDDELDEYVISGVCSAWVHRTEALPKTKNGVTEGTSCSIRVPMGDLPKSGIKCGDFIYCGVLEAVDISKCERVVKVTSSKFGLNPHLHLEAGVQ